MTIKKTITIDARIIQPAIYLFAKQSDFTHWNIDTQTGVVSIEYGKSGTYEYNTSYTEDEFTVYAYVFDTPQVHPTKHLTYEVWATIAVGPYDNVIKVNQ